MTKQFLLAAAPPPRGGGIFLQLSSKQLAKPTAFGALTAATETARYRLRAHLPLGRIRQVPAMIPDLSFVCCFRRRTPGRVGEPGAYRRGTDHLA
jgi:hypothetical protein